MLMPGLIFAYEQGSLVLHLGVTLHVSLYGLMLALAFFVANFLLQKEFYRLQLGQQTADLLLLLAFVGGLSGAKLFFLWESRASWSNWSQLGQLFWSAGGLTWYGGLVVASLLIFLFLRWKKIPFWWMADLLTPHLALGYAFGRMGCMLSGDGCYGIAAPPPGLPWPLAASFEHGAAPWQAMIDLYHDPAVRVYNTPLFESTFSLLLFVIFWLLRKKSWPAGIRFNIFLLLHSVFRYCIETIRLNPQDVWGLTQAQFVSVLAALFSVLFLFSQIKGARSWSQ